MFEKWPYTNLYNLNLDWIVGKIKELAGAIDTLPESVKQEVIAEIGTPYSSKNPPPYPVNSVNGEKGDVTVTAPVQSVNEQTGDIVVNAVALLEGDDTPGTLPAGWLENYYNQGVRVMVGAPLETGSYQTLYVLEKTSGGIDWYQFTPPGGGGGGAVDSVNGKKGVVVLKISDLANDAGYLTANTAVTKVNEMHGDVTVNAAYIADGTDTPETMTSTELHSLYNSGVRVVGCLPDTSGNVQALYILEQVGADVEWSKFNPPGGGGGGAVDSVNGKKGVVVLKISDLDNDAGYITEASIPGVFDTTKAGLVPAPSAANTSKFLTGAKTWSAAHDIYTANITTSMFEDGPTAHIDIPGIKATDTPIVSIYTAPTLPGGGTNPYNDTTFRAIRTSFANIYRIDTTTNGIDVYTSGAISSDFTIMLEVVH